MRKCGATFPSIRQEEEEEEELPRCFAGSIVLPACHLKLGTTGSVGVSKKKKFFKREKKSILDGRLLPGKSVLILRINSGAK